MAHILYLFLFCYYLITYHHRSLIIDHEGLIFVYNLRREGGGERGGEGLVTSMARRRKGRMRKKEREKEQRTHFTGQYIILYDRKIVKFIIVF